MDRRVCGTAGRNEQFDENARGFGEDEGKE